MLDNDSSDEEDRSIDGDDPVFKPDSFKRVNKESRRKANIQARISTAALSLSALPQGSNCHLSALPQAYLDYDVDQPLNKKQIMQLLGALYADHPIRVFNAISRDAIEAQDAIGDLIYGEVTFLALSHILERHLPNCKSGGRVFYDLGSGAGKSVFAAALLHPAFTKLCGIELIDGHEKLSQELLFLYSREILPHLPPHHHEQKISFGLGDALAADWSDGDVVLANSTCFSPELMRNLEERATQMMRPGALFISLTRRFQHISVTDAWELLESFERRMSWGPAEVHVHRRRMN
mmetsp:Transcript_278/g.491  ORF Transcript_278/g.491 Transcript_278/m.491 type:complete len:293 (+) Transcript_278:158-1036(+)|eukprot:CAMPEP_0198201046 /NCGR_PEP_ID=MMETSP1445-20131203/3872_1 /TAXON_ID=36898 /ORGANISM="Pyramimonas sp., Strain CCMP2087" /LENGTH=292 /DNA_ID=CAMNT_0043871229 /DNA_START=124 /DNA_END=1002 /DNA_ORIENTATION=+